MKCACKCGEEFEPERGNQIYKDASHRQRDKERRWPRKRRSAFRVILRNGYRERQEAQTSGVPPLLGTEMAETLRERRKVKNRRMNSNQFLSRFQVAELLGISLWTLIYWQKNGKGLQFIKLGPHTVRYPAAELNKWLASLPRG